MKNLLNLLYYLEYMNSKLKPAIIVLRINSVIYFCIAAFLLLLTIVLKILVSETLPILSLLMIMFGIGMITAWAIFVEIVIKGLKNGKKWAWIMGIVISAILIPSIFIVLGIIGLITLLDKEVVASFQK